MPTSAACPHLPRRLQLLCLFSIILNMPFKNLSNKCRKAFAPALRGISPPTLANTLRHKKIHPHPPRRHAPQSAHHLIHPHTPATPPPSRYAPPSKIRSPPHTQTTTTPAQPTTPIPTHTSPQKNPPGFSDLLNISLLMYDQV